MCNNKPGLKLSTELYTEPKKADAKKSTLSAVPLS